MDRLEYLLGPDAAAIVADYDLDDESDRMELVDEYLPLPMGRPGREARMAMRTVAFNQIVSDTPPATWLTVERLREMGMDRDAILSQLSMVITEQLSNALEERTEFDLDAYTAELGALPLPSGAELASAFVSAVRAQPGIVVDELFDRVCEPKGPAGRRLVEAMADHVFDHLIDGPLHLLPDDGVVHTPTLVDGVTYAHRVNDAELSLQVLNVAVDLGAFTSCDEHRLNGGAAVEQFSMEPGHLAWRGPDGWLADFSADDLLAVTVHVVDEADDDHDDDGNGTDEWSVATLEMSIAAEPAMSDEAAAAVRAAYEALIEEAGMPVRGDELALWLCFHRPELFGRSAPLQLPLDELCEHLGLERRGGFIAGNESMWRRQLMSRRVEEVSALVPEREWRLVILQAMEVLDDPESGADDVRAALHSCADDAALDTLADVLFPHYLDADDAFDPTDTGRSDAPMRLFELVDRALAAARRPTERATAEYLAAVLYERCAMPTVAEEHLVRAAAAQSHLGSVIERLGWYRFDRGDADGALRWWRRLSDEHPAAALIESIRSATSTPQLGRNEKCWCGSGRKFKQCHLGASELPALPDRVAWLCRKASLWLEHSTGEPRQSALIMAVARALGDPEGGEFELRDLGDEEASRRLQEAWADPIVFDTVLHEGGLFQLFLHERGALLPDDEQLLVASWLTVERSVHEVVALERGSSLTLRDLATGEVVDVRERTASRQATVGELYCARVVPDGESHQIVGGVFPVPAGRESAVLDLCAERDGAAICAWVGALFAPPSIVHSPGMIDSMIDRDAIDSAIAALGDDADEAAVLAVISAEFARQAQAHWLDDRVPALGGLTPREAAADPTRREQLVRLLDEFDRRNEALDALASEGDGMPESFRPMTYDVAALRRELGLT